MLLARDIIFNNLHLILILMNMWVVIDSANIKKYFCIADEVHCNSRSKYETSLPVIPYPKEILRQNRTPQSPGSHEKAVVANSTSMTIMTSETSSAFPRHRPNGRKVQALQLARSLTRDNHHHHFHHKDQMEKLQPYLETNNNVTKTYQGEKAEIDCIVKNSGEQSVSIGLLYVPMNCFIFYANLKKVSIILTLCLFIGI